MSYFITIGIPTQMNISTLHLCYKDANSSKISQSVFLSAKKLFIYFCIYNGCSTDILGKSNNNQVSVFIDDMKSLSAGNNVMYYFTHFYREDIYSEKIDDYETIKIDLTTFITEFPNLKENCKYVINTLWPER